MSESIGAIKVPVMIWTSTILTLGALGICVRLCLLSGRRPKYPMQPSSNQHWSTPTPSSSGWEWCTRCSSTSWNSSSSNGGLIVCPSPKIPPKWQWLARLGLLCMDCLWPASIVKESISNSQSLPPSVLPSALPTPSSQSSAIYLRTEQWDMPLPTRDHGRSRRSSASSISQVSSSEPSSTRGRSMCTTR